MLQPENLLLALLIVAGAYAWYRSGFRTPRALHLPVRAPRRALAAFGWMLVLGIALKLVGGLFGDGRIQVAQSGVMYASRAREPMRFWEEVVGELLLVGGTGALLILLGSKPAREATRDA